MGEHEEIIRLLTEIRDAQREHLGEYRRIAERSVALQEASVAKYEQNMRLYRRLVIAVTLAATLLIVALALGLLT